MYYWYIFKGWLRARTNEWWYEFLPDAIGDALYNNALYSLIAGDHILTQVIYQLRQGFRWPAEWTATEPRIASNMLQYRWRKLLHNLDDSWNLLYRPIQRMTFDPYVATIFAMKMKGCVWQQQIHEIKIPWYLYRPDRWLWKKALLKKMDGITTWRWVWYERIQLLNLRLFGRRMPTYALHMAAMMAVVAESEKVKQRLHDLIPEWNYYLKLLTGHPDVDEIEFEVLVREYIGKTGFQWNANQWDPPGIWDDEEYWRDDKEFMRNNTLHPDSEIKLDYDLLQWAFRTFGYSF